MAGSGMTAYKWPHRGNSSIVGANEAKTTDFTTVDAATSIVAGGINIRGLPKAVLVLKNDGGGGKSLTYTFYGITAEGGEPYPIPGKTGTLADGGVIAESVTDGWDFIDIKVNSTSAGNPTTGFVEVKARAV